jgi:hypothetical protein
MRFDGDDPLLAPGQIRKAIVRLPEIARRYEAIQDARVAMKRVVGPPEVDVSNVFGEVRNAADLWDFEGQTWTPETGSMPNPWPTDDTVEKLRRFLDHGAEVWLPTPAEQDEAMNEYLTERRESEQAIRVSASGF